MEISEYLYTSTIYSNNISLEYFPLGQPETKSLWPCSPRRAGVKKQTLPAVGIASPNCQVHFQFHLDLRMSEQMRKRRFKERVLIPIILLFPVSTIKITCSSVHLSLTNICRDVISHENDQMHWTESVNSQKAATVSRQTSVIVKGICISHF